MISLSNDSLFAVPIAAELLALLLRFIVLFLLLALSLSFTLVVAATREDGVVVDVDVLMKGIRELDSLFGGITGLFGGMGGGTPRLPIGGIIDDFLIGG